MGLRSFSRNLAINCYRLIFLIVNSLNGGGGNWPLAGVAQLGLCVVEDIFLGPAGGLVAAQDAAKLHGVQHVQLLQGEHYTEARCSITEHNQIMGWHIKLIIFSENKKGDTGV